MAEQNSPQVNNLDSDVLIRPVVSEKSTQAEQEGKYTFEVQEDATKVDIKNAVSKIYGVRPTKVNTMNITGKKKRFRFQEGRTKDYKKAIVTLPEDETINIHQGV